MESSKRSHSQVNNNNHRSNDRYREDNNSLTYTSRPASRNNNNLEGANSNKPQSSLSAPSKINILPLRKSRKIELADTVSAISGSPAQHIRFAQDLSDTEDYNFKQGISDRKDEKSFDLKVVNGNKTHCRESSSLTSETTSDDNDKPEHLGNSNRGIFTTNQQPQNPFAQHEYSNSNNTTESPPIASNKRRAFEFFEKQPGDDVSLKKGTKSQGSQSFEEQESKTTLTLSRTTLERVDRWKQKKQLKKLKSSTIGFDGIGLPSSYPGLTFNLDGFKGKIGMKDIRELILWCLADGGNPSWMLVRNRQHFRKFVVLFTPGLDPSLFNLSYDTHRNQSHPINMASLPQKAGKPLAVENMPSFTGLFKEVVLTKGPGEKTRIYSPVMGVMQCPLSNTEKQRRMAERKAYAKKNTIHTPNALMLTLDEMIEAGYPIPSSMCSARLDNGWVETKPAPEQSNQNQTGKKKLIAIDCEMCTSALGSELTRVTLIGEDSMVIFDELVMPSEPIVDYLTQFSGITEERLRGTTTTLQDVQKRLLDIIDHDTILVGHSLEFDLKALKIAHPHVIDTARVYHHPRGPPYKPSLKWLANRWMNRQIQASASGHDSAEDARACMDLIKLKLKSAPDFGHYQVDTEPLFVRLERHNPPRYGAVVDSGTAGAGMYSSKARSVEVCEDDRHTIAKVLEVVQNHDFVCARLREPERFYGDVCAVTEANESEPQGRMDITKGELPASLLRSGSPSPQQQPMPTEEVVDMLKNLDVQVQKLYDGLPNGTALVVLSGVGDVREAQRLINKQNHYRALWQRLPQSQIPEMDQWTDQDMKYLEVAVDRAKMGVGFFCVK